MWNNKPKPKPNNLRLDDEKVLVLDLQLLHSFFGDSVASTICEKNSG